MPRTEDRFDDFHTGLSAGYAAGQDRTVLYLVGFLAGFVWGAVSGVRTRRLETVPREAAQ